MDRSIANLVKLAGMGSTSKVPALKVTCLCKKEIEQVVDYTAEEPPQPKNIERSVQYALCDGVKSIKAIVKVKFAFCFSIDCVIW